MPNVGSWNGKYAGEPTYRYIIRKYRKKADIPPFWTEGKRSFLYDFRDGWTARVDVIQIDAKEAARRNKITNGFGRYDWMPNSII